MIICGVSMDGSSANLCIVKCSGSDYEVISSKIKKISLDDDADQDSIKSFYQEFHDFIQSNEVDMIAVKARQHKGKFAGGPVSFKIESLIQLSECEVCLMPSRVIAQKTKTLKVPASLFKYQVEAFRTACSLFMIKQS